jgi:hypothetical protein
MRITIASQPTREGRRVVVAELPAAIVELLIALATAWGTTRSEVLGELLRRSERGAAKELGR